MNLSNINSEKKFSSLYLVEQINLFRKEEGGRVNLRHSDFLSKIENEFSEEITERKISPSDYKDNSGVYMLYGKYQGQNLTETRTHSFAGSTGDTRTSSYLVWTEKGREFIHRQVNSSLNYAVVQTQATA